jgi:hypothetical protein
MGYRGQSPEGALVLQSSRGGDARGMAMSELAILIRMECDYQLDVSYLGHGFNKQPGWRWAAYDDRIAWCLYFMPSMSPWWLLERETMFDD